MTPRLSVIASAIRRVISGAANAVSSLDPYWDKVVALIHGDSNVDKDDPYWNHVALLIHGNGTNGSTVITDQKEKTVTANGNVQISTAQSRFKGSSIYFDGSGDYLSVPADIDFTFGAGDFTIEGYFYFTTTAPTYQGIIDMRTSGVQVVPVLTITGSKLAYFVSGSFVIQSSTLAINTWYHFSISRSSGVTKMYIDGVQSGSSYTDSNSYGCNQVLMGSHFDGYSFNGYLQDLRITKGIARYTTTFNVPTSPFPNQLPTTYDPFAANTVLAMHMDGTNGSATFYDQCGKTITANGNVQISTALSKFGGASAYFDGNGDYFTTSAIAIGSGEDFTLELWACPTAISYNTALIEEVGSRKGLIFLSDGSLYWMGSSDLNTGSKLTVNSMTHIAVSRGGGITRVFKSGVQVGQVSDTCSFANGFAVGNDIYGQYFSGYIDDLRVTKGVARYTANFTPPTKQFVDPVNDLLEHKPIPYGNATLGSGGVFNQCMQFDGTGDYYVIPSHTDYDFGSQDFTIEFWFKTAQTTAYASMLGREWVSSPYSGGFNIFANNGASGPLAVWWADYSTGSAFLTASTNTHRDNQWHHFAWVRNGNDHYMFLDGVVVATATSSLSFSSVTKRIAIGTDLTYAGRDFNGYIDELRITKGVARYTTTFTPQDLPHPNSYVEADPFLANVVMHVPMMSPNDKYWDNTSLLIPGNGANGSTSIFEARGKTVTANGNAQVSTTQSKFNGSSLYFDGSGDYLSVPAHTDFALNAGNFTIEAWVYSLSFADYRTVYESRESDGSVTGFIFLINAVGQVCIYTNGGFQLQVGTLSLNTWHHIAVVRAFDVWSIFIDGVKTGGIYTSANNQTNTTIRIGAAWDTANYFYGYLQDLRIIKGVACYTADFTLPTKSFLAFEDKKANALTYVGDAKLSRVQKKFTQISGYFNGTNSHVKTVSNVAANISGQDITIEGWIYLADVVGEKCICGYNNTSSSDFWDLRVSTAALKFRSRASSTDTSVSGGTLVASTWTHVAVVKSGTNVTLYVDGVSVATSSALAIPNIATAQIGIGANLYGGSYWDYFKGYMQDLRITQAARYLSNFTVPATPLPMV